MKIRNKMLLILLATLLLIGGVIALIWYRASSELTNTYLEDVSESSIRDACNAFGYPPDRYVLYGNAGGNQPKEYY